jgi:hypothetical protein
MIRRGMDRVSRRARIVRAWLARRVIKYKPELRWYLIYGLPRSGTSYMLRIVSACSALYVGDWGLAPILDPVPDWLESRSASAFDYIRFNYERLLRDISNNILDNAYLGEGNQLDLVYKQAALGSNQYQVFVKMWGRPARTIFCLREPTGYIASAVRKFIYDSVERLQEVYIDSINSYLQIGGDIFEYTPDLSVSDYISFLQPLNFKGKCLPPFQYKGEQDHEHVTDEMWSAYYRVKEFVRR